MDNNKKQKLFIYIFQNSWKVKRAKQLDSCKQKYKKYFIHFIQVASKQASKRAGNDTQSLSFPHKHIIFLHSFYLSLSLSYSSLFLHTYLALMYLFLIHISLVLVLLSTNLFINL